MTLGELIDILEEIAEKDSDASVYIKPYDLIPAGFDSYRGYYEDLALIYTTNGECNVDKLLKWAKKTNNKELTGYKGGEFLMTRRTPIWISNYGKVSDVMLTKVEHPYDGYVYLYGKLEEE